MIFFAAASANQNDLVEREAREAGAENIRVSSGGVEFEADLETAYRFTLWTRCSPRLLVLVHRYEGIDSTDALYEHSLTLGWENWLNPQKTFAVTETVSNCRWIQNSHFAALRFKDALVERIRLKYDGVRPNVDRDDPDITFHLHVNQNLVSWYVDFAGRGLSHRGYRTGQTEAVMTEFLAASLLCRSQWYKLLKQNKKALAGDPLSASPAAEEASKISSGTEMRASNHVLLDVFCGSGSICIEAALISTNTAPGLLRPDRFAFHKLPLHDESLWQKVLAEAESAKCAPASRVIGWDIDPAAVEISRKNAMAAGMENVVSFEVRDFTKTTAEDVENLNSLCTGDGKGCVVTDPPYGVRLRNSADLKTLYRKSGEIFYSLFGGWYITVLCGETSLLSYIDMKPDRTNILMNGGIECQAAHYYVFSARERERMLQKARERREERLAAPLSPGAQMAANRLSKNLASLGKDMAAQGVSCYRLYDADMPEYSAALDIYEGRWINLQEYAAPASIDPAAAARRLEELVLAAERVTGIDLENIYVKKRERQKGASQYTRRGNAASSHFFTVTENGHRFSVNFSDYLDTGLFLDHRPVRKLIETMSMNKRFLNLFCYTGTATVYAAAGGALSSVSVDASTTYLDWAMRNMRINGYDTMNHFFYKSDCIEWLRGTRDTFDLIFCDPPTFSNSKSRGTFDVQRDHGYLIRSCMKHLSPEGTLIFSNNFSRFRLFEELYDEFEVEDITQRTIGEDFKRSGKIHCCYLIRHKKRQAAKTGKLRLVRKAARKDN